VKNGLTDVQFFSPLTVSISQTSSGLLMLASKEEAGSEFLIFAGYVQSKKSLSKLIKDLLPTFKDMDLLSASAIRLAFPPSDRHLFTEHLLETHFRKEPLESKAADIAWRHDSLLEWGESRAAKVLSSHLSVPVRTIHTRLQMARDKGLLASPGNGNRLKG